MTAVGNVLIGLIGSAASMIVIATGPPGYPLQKCFPSGVSLPFGSTGFPRTLMRS